LCPFGAILAQKLNSFICEKKKSDFLTPLGPLGARPYRFEQKYGPNRLCDMTMTLQKTYKISSYDSAFSQDRCLFINLYAYGFMNAS
jgi:hypothetical protein